MADEELDDNWEALLENGALDKKFEEIDSRQQVAVETGVQDVSHCHVILQEDVPRTQYAPPQPLVKILKRPSGVGKSGEMTMNGDRVNKQPIKTLQQREAEYAQARLRILGAAKSEEDVVEERLSKITLAGGSEESGQDTSVCSSSSSTSRVEFLKIPDGVEVTRSPKGPDGSRGFHLRR